MKALSVRQPWAWAIVSAGKTVENRAWAAAPGYRGPLLLHAAAECTRAEYEAAALAMRAAGLVGRDGVARLPALGDLPRGGFVAVARLVDVRPNGPRPVNPWAAPGTLGLRLDDARALPFVPAKGRLGLFEVPIPETYRNLVAEPEPEPEPAREQLPPREERRSVTAAGGRELLARLGVRLPPAGRCGAGQPPCVEPPTHSTNGRNPLGLCERHLDQYRRTGELVHREVVAAERRVPVQAPQLRDTQWGWVATVAGEQEGPAGWEQAELRGVPQVPLEPTAEAWAEAQQRAVESAWERAGAWVSTIVLRRRR